MRFSPAADQLKMVPQCGFSAWNSRCWAAESALARSMIAYATRGTANHCPCGLDLSARGVGPDYGWGERRHWRGARETYGYAGDCRLMRERVITPSGRRIIKTHCVWLIRTMTNMHRTARPTGPFPYEARPNSQPGLAKSPPQSAQTGPVFVFTWWEGRTPP